MKIILHKHTFNDKSFWMMFSGQEAIEYFQPDYRIWEAQGIRFFIEDLNYNHNRYVRDIVITAEATTYDSQRALTALVLKTQNK